MLARLRQPWSDRRAELMLGALACAVLLTIVLMVVFVANEAWPTFKHNGLSWLGPGGNVDEQIGKMVNSGAGSHPPAADYHLRAWPLIWGTILTTGLAVVFGLVFAILAAIFIVEFAPARLRAVIVPVVRLLAAVPSVIFGLIGILVLVPFVGNHIINQGDKKSVEFVVQLTGASLLVAVVILTVMIVPIMIAIIVDALYAVPRGWKEGAVALGVNRWRAMWTVSVRAARPAIIAAAVLACARALGEAIMLSMVSGSVGFSPNPFDGPRLFLLEPLRPLASTIVEDAESLQAPAVRSTVYAFALLLLFSSLFLSLAGYLAKQPMKKYGVRI
jgi:phosphate ABC transporter permease protein PstC